jgi:hypothetical protein
MNALKKLITTATMLGLFTVGFAAAAPAADFRASTGTQHSIETIVVTASRLPIETVIVIAKRLAPLLDSIDLQRSTRTAQVRL